MKRTIAIVIGIGLLLLLGCAACAPSGPTLASKIEDLVGVWHRTELWYRAAEVYIEFKEDGTYHIASAPEELESHPLNEGEVWFEGAQLYWKDVDAVGGWRVCLGRDREIGIYEVQLVANGNLKFVNVEDKCGGRVGVLVEWFKKPTEWEPVR